MSTTDPFSQAPDRPAGAAFSAADPTFGAAPKALLHDHLDGGLRPRTIVELAADIGHPLPADDSQVLSDWFVRQSSSGSLERYLTTFVHTVAVMQSPDALARVARECAVDLAADGVVYAEVRYAPEQHLEDGLTLDEVVAAVQEGFEDGCADAAAAGTPIRVGTLVTAMRHAARSREIAELAVRHRDHGVVGFDIAGAEAGYPPSRHLDAFDYLHRENFHLTIHAGEAFGLPSIWEAVQVCRTDRLRQGGPIGAHVGLLGGPLRDADELLRRPDRFGRPRAHLGRVAAWIRDTRIPLNLCPSSNVQIGA